MISKKSDHKKNSYKRIKTEKSDASGKSFSDHAMQFALKNPHHEISSDIIMQMQSVLGNRKLLNRLKAESDLNNGDVEVMQRRVFKSATFGMGTWAENQVISLDRGVDDAEAQAVDDVTNSSKIHTPRQAEYIRRPNKANWGYCVEEKFDLHARAEGWSTQKRLSNSRPDYYKNNGWIHVFTDLTTERQAGNHGNHITEKLNRSIEDKQGLWQAADIAHQSKDPLGSSPSRLPVPNGTVTEHQMRMFQQYRHLLDDESEYVEGFDDLVSSYGRVSHATFTQRWDDEARIKFDDEISGLFD